MQEKGFSLLTGGGVLAKNPNELKKKSNNRDQSSGLSDSLTEPMLGDVNIRVRQQTVRFVHMIHGRECLALISATIVLCIKSGCVS